MVLLSVLLPVVEMLKSVERCVKRHSGILPGRRTALVKRQSDGLSADEPGTYGFNFL